MNCHVLIVIFTLSRNCSTLHEGLTNLLVLHAKDNQHHFFHFCLFDLLESYILIGSANIVTPVSSYLKHSRA